MEKKRSTAWSYIDSTVCVAHWPRSNVRDTFGEFFDDLAEHPSVDRMIVLAYDAAPTAQQRAVIQRWFQQTSAPCAVLTNSLLARGAVTALAWFGITIRAFPRDEHNAALEFVGVPRRSWPASVDTLQRLDREMLDQEA